MRAQPEYSYRAALAAGWRDGHERTSTRWPSTDLRVVYLITRAVSRALSGTERGHRR